jgi:holo-[acyl-carrier protein] synthase
VIQKLFSGIDLVEIARFRELNPQIRERFFTRVFTPDEMAYIEGSFERAAGIFAAKEALAKALGCGIGYVSWHEMGIYYEINGKPLAILTGKAKVLEQELGIFEWSVSISHTRNNAVAVAVAFSHTDG